MPQQQQRRAAPVIGPIPFTAAAHQHVEQCFAVTQALGAQQFDISQRDVPSYGFMRHILLQVDCTGGTLGSGVLHPDWPWNLLQGIQLLDTNGAPICGPLDGYQLYLANKYGAYSFRQDPKADPGYDGSINARFLLRIPVEISKHNAYGSIANQNSSDAYKIQLSLAHTGKVFTTQPTTPPTVSVRAHLQAWSQPAAADLAQRPQETEPVGHGTTQFWSATSKAVVAGMNNIGFPRVGNLIRNWVLVARDANGLRSDSAFPDPFILQHDARNFTSETQRVRIKLQEEGFQDNSVRETGVFVFPFNHMIAGIAGDEEPNYWLPTVQASRVELQGQAAVAGSLTIMTNDITAVEVDPRDRYVQNSQTGFQPALGQPVPAGAM